MADDAELLARWRDGDNAAGSELFHRYFEPVRRFFASKVVDGVDDLVQQTFLACVNSRERIRPDLGFRPYVFAAARSKLYDHLRKQGRSPSFDAERDSIAETGRSPSAVVASRQDEQIVLQAMRQLPTELQVCLELYYFEGMRGPELAVALGAPEGTIRGRLRRGLRLLRDHVQRLAQSPELRRDTETRLDAWAEHVKHGWDETNRGE